MLLYYIIYVTINLFDTHIFVYTHIYHDIHVFQHVRNFLIFKTLDVPLTVCGSDPVPGSGSEATLHHRGASPCHDFGYLQDPYPTMKPIDGR